MSPSDRIAARFVRKAAVSRNFWIAQRLRPPGAIFAVNVTTSVKAAALELQAALTNVKDHGAIHFVQLTRGHSQVACQVPVGALYHPDFKGLRVQDRVFVNTFDKDSKARASGSVGAWLATNHCSLKIPSVSTLYEDYLKAYITAKTRAAEIQEVLAQHGIRTKPRIRYEAELVAAVGDLPYERLKIDTETDMVRVLKLALDLEKIQVNVSQIRAEVDRIAQRFENERQREITNKALLSSLGIDHIDHNEGCSGYRCLTGHLFMIYPIPGITLDVDRVMEARYKLGMNYMETDPFKIELLPDGVLKVTYEIDSSD